MRRIRNIPIKQKYIRIGIVVTAIIVFIIGIAMLVVGLTRSKHESGELLKFCFIL